MGRSNPAPAILPGVILPGAILLGALLTVTAAAPAAADAACTARSIAAVPLAENWNFLVFPAAIGGAPASMLLDSGADAGLVTVEAATRLGLGAGGEHTTIEGTGGTSVAARTVMLPELIIGSLHVPPHPVPVAPLPTEPRVQPPVAGLVGSDLLAGFEVDIDLPDGRLAFLRLAGSCPDFRPWAGAAPLPVARDGDRLVISVTLDGQKLRALIDTGARSTILDTGAAARIGLTADALAKDPGGVSGGVDLRPVLYHWHRFARLEIGPVTDIAPVLTVSPVHEAADLLLGADFFARHRVWLSYGTGAVFISPSSPVAPSKAAPAGAASAR